MFHHPTTKGADESTGRRCCRRSQAETVNAKTAVVRILSGRGVDDTSTWLPSHASGDKQRWTNSSGEGCISSQFLRFASVGRITQVWRGATGEKRRTNCHYTLLCGDSRRGVAAATRCESSRLVTPSHLCILCISKPYMPQCSYRLRVFLFGSRFVFVNTMESYLAASTRHPDPRRVSYHRWGCDTSFPGCKAHSYRGRAQTGRYFNLRNRRDRGEAEKESLSGSIH